MAHSRQLGGHTFLYPILQQSALITTQFGLHEGVAFFDVPDLPVITLGLRDVSLKGFQQTLELELGLTDWLGLEGFARGTLVMGATPTELLLGGAQRSLVGQAGGVARLLRSEKTGTQLSFRAHGSYQDGAEININPLLNGLVTSPVQTVGAVLDGNLRELIVVPTSEMSVRGGLYLAQAFSALFSLQASAAMEYGWLTRKPFSGMLDTRVTQKGDALRVLLAFALAADFGPKGVPVGVMGEYQLIAGRDHEENRADRSLGASTVALGVYYTGRPHLQLGVGLATTLHAEPLRGVGTLGEELLSGDPTLDYGQLVLRYIW
ncbi:MAG: hypothetical protein ACJ8AT_16545 [Hyalangium sp.]